MPNTILIQRMMAHYREPVFAGLYERYGWETVLAANPPQQTFLNLSEQQQRFAHRFDYRFPDPANPHVCEVPLDAIIDALQPRRIIAEFSMSNSLWRQLPIARWQGRIESYALWSHGWNMERGFRKPKDLAAQAARLAAMVPADLLLTYTEEGRAWVRRFLPFKTVVAIGNTLDIEKIRRESADVEPIRYGSPQLLAVGRMKPDKGFRKLLDVYHLILRRLPGAALTIIGDGPEREKIMALAKSRGYDNIRLPGALYGEKAVAPHFKGADFFILAGAAGLSLNHALAYDLPIATYGRGAGLPRHHPEIAYAVPGKTAVVATDPRPETLAAMVVDAYESGQHRNLKQQISAYVDDHAHLEGMLRQFGRVDAAL